MTGIFVSHASADDAFVADLRRRLEQAGLAVWVDSRELRGGDGLAPEIEAAIGAAPHVVVVLGPETVNSPWVAREVRRALEVRDARDDGYRVVPLLLPGLTARALGRWFPQEPIAVTVGPDGLAAAMPDLLAALGERLPTDREEWTAAPAGAVEELVLRLSGPRVVEQDGVRRVRAVAQLVHEPAGPGRRAVESSPFAFTAPLGPIEAADLRWYLERYWLWPVGVFRERARGIEARLPEWGRALLGAARGDGHAFDAWERAGRDGALRRFSVLVDDAPPVDLGPADGDGTEATGRAREAATELLALPWELLHDGDAWLFQGRHAVRVRRRLPNRTDVGDHRSGLPIRILLVSPRPDRTAGGDRVGYLDHRASAGPLVDTVESLGELARLTVLTPPTYTALEQALHDGDDGHPFDVLHVDGHGVYDPRVGLGALCFEEPVEPGQRDARTLDLVDAGRMAALVRHHRIPLVFLDACQTAQSGSDPTASVAARLLDEGVASVVAMTHSVLVETARRFVEAFYRELAGGARVGTAMLAGQRALAADPRRGTVVGAGELRMQDWFVPVLYQERLDPQPITRLPAPTVRELAARVRTLALGELPEPPEHRFQGRSRELLALERHLHRERWAVVRGTGGQGKTTLAVELARWLVRTHRAQRAVFVSLDHHREPRAVLDAVGRQLVPGYSVATFDDGDAALRPVLRALADDAVVLVVDNVESVLPDPGLPDEPVDPDPDEEDAATAVFALCRRLLDAAPRTRLVFTTRESLPAPFADVDHEWELGALHRDDAVELVGRVMARHGWAPPGSDSGGTPQEVADLVEAVHGHPRALVLLAREVARQGVRGTTADLARIMADLDRRYPGDRENSLLASVALSLRRLGPEAREHVRNLAHCRGGVFLAVLAELTGTELDPAIHLARDLIAVGLGEDMGDGYLRLDPGLSPYLLAELSGDETDAAQARWADSMVGFVTFLANETFRDARLARRLTVLDVSNLVRLLDWLPGHRSPSKVVSVAAELEEILQEIGMPHAYGIAVRVREAAARELGGWNRAQHVAATAEIERFRAQGDIDAAYTASARLLEQHRTRGENAYPGADYDIAVTYVRLGWALRSAGNADAALEPLGEARRRFRLLVGVGHRDAESMLAKTAHEIGDCLQDLGRLERAAESYEDSIRELERIGEGRSAANTMMQLASLKLRQGRVDEALDGYAAVRAAFEAMGEPTAVAITWHQSGVAYQEAGRADAAEEAYMRALAIEVQEGDLPGEAATLGQMGTLYGEQDRHEEAIVLHTRAADIHTRLGHRAMEGVARHNLGTQLLMAGRHDEARREVQRAVACNSEFPSTTEPWLTWIVLEEVETATGHLDAARAARRESVDAYLSYRLGGGYSRSTRLPVLDAVRRAVADGTADEYAQQMATVPADDGASPTFAALLRVCSAILTGRRDRALADDSDLHPLDVVELLLLLDELDPPPPEADPD